MSSILILFQRRNQELFAENNLRTTILYFAGGAAISTLMAMILYFSNTHTFNCWKVFGMLPCLYASLALFKYLPHKEEFGVRQVVWMVVMGLVGALVAKLMYLEGPSVIIKAICCACGIYDCVSALALFGTPIDTFAGLRDTLEVAFCSLILSFIAMWSLLPRGTPQAAIGDVIVIYSGSLIFLLYVFYDIQNTVHQAKAKCADLPFDPLFYSTQNFMNLFCLFLGIVQIMLLQKKNII